MLTHARSGADCGKTRGIGWFLEGLLMLAPFGKQPLSIRLKGITNEEVCVCVCVCVCVHPRMCVRARAAFCLLYLIHI